MSARRCGRCGSTAHNRRRCNGGEQLVSQIPAQLDPRARPDLIPVERRMWEALMPHMIKPEPPTPEAMVQARADVEPLVCKLVEVAHGLATTDRYRVLERIAEAMLTGSIDEDIDEAETLAAIHALRSASPSYRHVEWSED